METAERFGGEILTDYLALGRYNNLAESSFPDAASVARFNLARDEGGLFRTATMRAFDTDEYGMIIQS